MPAGSGITLRNSAEADIPTPASGQVTIFNDSDASNKPAYKDSTGAVSTLATAGSGNPKGSRAYNSGAFSVPASAETAVTLDSERSDDGGFHSTSVNTSRMTVPTGAGGRYGISGTVEWAASALGTLRRLSIRLNGATFIGKNEITSIINAPLPQSVSTDYDLVAGDYVELVAFQDTVGAVNLGASGNYSPEFAVSLAGQIGATGATGAAGSGAAHSYIGYNTAGASSEALGTTIIAKQVVLAAAGLISSIGAYLHGTDTGNIQSLGVALYSDVAGVPGLVLGAGDISSNGIELLVTNPGTNRWFHAPLGLWVPAGTYWLAILPRGNGSALTISYDTSGSDNTVSASAGNGFKDWTGGSVGSKKYSIRADFLS